MLRRLLLLTVAAAWLAACAGAPQQAATSTPAPDNPSAQTAMPIVTATPTPAAVDETQAPPAMVEPPPATVTINGATQVSGIGTYCWSADADSGGVGVCVDKMGVPTARDPIQVAAVPFIATLTFPLETAPSSVSLTLIPVSADQEMTVDGTPDWRWWPFGEGQTYEVTAGVTSEVELAPGPGLYALTAFTFFEGRGDVVYGFLIQVGEPEQTGGGEGMAFTLPASCLPREGLSPYVDPGGRYCLLFPAHFRIGDVTLDRANFYGPPLDQSIEPVFAALTVSVNGLSGDLSLAQVVDEYVAGAGAGLPVTRSPLTIGGVPAEMVEGLPGRTPNSQIFFLHGGLVYQLSVFPLGADFAQAAPDIDAVWGAVSASFTFLP